MAAAGEGGGYGLGHHVCMLASAEVFSFPGAKERILGERLGRHQVIYHKSHQLHGFIPIYSSTR